MRKFSITLRLRLSLVIVIGAALLKVGAWLNLSVYAVSALLWALWLRVRFRPLVQLLGAELLLLTSMALPLGWERASFLLARALVCLLTMNSFLLSLPPHSGALALKGLPLPAPLQESLLLATQYLEILLSEISQMQRAAQLRGLRGSAGWLRYISAATIGSLYIRTLHRAERVYSAMVIRGYQGKLPVDTKLTAKETIALTATALFATAVTLNSY